MSKKSFESFLRCLFFHVFKCFSKFFHAKNLGLGGAKNPGLLNEKSTAKNSLNCYVVVMRCYVLLCFCWQKKVSRYLDLASRPQTPTPGLKLPYVRANLQGTGRRGTKKKKEFCYVLLGCCYVFVMFSYVFLLKKPPLIARPLFRVPGRRVSRGLGGL